jgi:hypothetical protein
LNQTQRQIDDQDSAWILLAIAAALPVRNWRHSTEVSNSPEFRALIRDRERRFAFEQTERRWREEAESAMLASATNDVAGAGRITGHSVDFVDAAPAHWIGAVAMKFADKFGELHELHLTYRFRLYRPHEDDLEGSRVDAYLDREDRMHEMLRSLSR